MSRQKKKKEETTRENSCNFLKSSSPNGLNCRSQSNSRCAPYPKLKEDKNKYIIIIN